MQGSFCAGAAIFLFIAAPLLGQQTPPRPRPDSARADTAVTRVVAPRIDSARADSSHLRVQPRTAFIRSLLLPGWGQISAGANKSAAVFIGLQAASDFMLVKTIKKLNDAQSLEPADRTRLQDSLFKFLAAPGGDTIKLHSYQTNPALLQLKLDSISPAHSLVLSRKKQREDWITLAVFWTLASAADAFVVAQLSDFPADVMVEPRSGGGMLLRIGIRARRPW
jgi:hypothetical protein